MNISASDLFSTIVEFLEVDYVESRGGANWEIISGLDENGNWYPFYAPIRAMLREKNGIHIFYDSRGSAIYAGQGSGSVDLGRGYSIFQ